MFAVIKSGGRQYKVSVGQKLEVNRLHVEDGAQVTFDEVLLISDEDTSMVGTPFVNNAMVLATAVEQTRGKKLIVFRYKSKKRFRHKRGHRQELTLLSIDDIIAEGKSLITGKAPQAKETPEADTEAEMVTPPTATETSGDASAEPQTSRRRRNTLAEEDTENETEEK